MKYEVDQTIFSVLPDACFGIVAATEIGPAKDPAVIEALLAAAVHDEKSKKNAR